MGLQISSRTPPEHLALRHQPVLLRSGSGLDCRPPIDSYGVAVRSLERLAIALVIFKPEPSLRGTKEGFGLFWTVRVRHGQPVRTAGSKTARTDPAK